MNLLREYDGHLSPFKTRVLDWSFKTITYHMIKKDFQFRLGIQTKDYGRPMKPFFIEIQNFWAWADRLGR